MELLLILLVFACLFLKINISSLGKKISRLQSRVDDLDLLENRISRLAERLDALIPRDGSASGVTPAPPEPDEEQKADVPDGEKTDPNAPTFPAAAPATAGPDWAPAVPDPHPEPAGPPPLPEPVEVMPETPFAEVPAASYTDRSGTGERPASAFSPKTPDRKNGFFEKWRALTKNVDWELFTGTKLFAWLGVFALFLGILFFVKLSMDRGWFPPAFRLALGAVTGLFLCLFSVRKTEETYRLLRHTLAAAGVGVLYGVVFAATLYYDYLPKPAGFMLLSLISATAFVLSVYHRALSISILGAVGAFLTPVLVNTGSGSLVMLFVYLALVNTGLFLVAGRLCAPVLVLIGAAGTLVSLGLGTLSMIHRLTGYDAGGAWAANTLLFTLFLYAQRHLSPDETRSLRHTGYLTFVPALLVAVALTLSKPGWMPLFLITACVCCALVVTWFHRGWLDRLIPFAAMSFAAALTWTVLRFDIRSASVSFALIFLYGAAGSLGPLALVRKHGMTPRLALWFKAFPTAVSALCLLGLFRNPGCSFLFWPVILGVQVLGLFVSLLIRAFFQVLILIVLFVSGGLFWMAHIPEGGMGLTFFIFILIAGFLVTGLITLAAGKLPQLFRMLHIGDAGNTISPAYESWLTAAPTTGIAVLLGVAFLLPFPHYPHPGMATLCCFLVLALFFSRRTGFEPTAVLALLSGLLAQAVWVLLPVSGQAHPGGDILWPALFWSAGLFVAALLGPFIVYKDHQTSVKTWSSLALFEVVQFLFFFVSAKNRFSDPWVHWLPLAPALFKLPCVALLFGRLKNSPCRNTLLAFHGGVLLFYVSALPVLLLDHGRLGLCLVVEATALLWLKTRIDHPGLQKTAAVMSPVGLGILLFNLPLLKSAESLVLLNPAVLSVAAATLALSAAVRLSDDSRCVMKTLSIRSYYRWLALLTGFFLVNLAVADVFAPAGTPFRVLPSGRFIHAAAYALSWVLFGAALWKSRVMPRVMRMTGLVLLTAGALSLIALPIVMPRSIAPMGVFFNTALFAYAAMLSILFFLFLREPWDDRISLFKNLFLALFLVTVFMAVKTLKFTLFQNGDPFALITEKTARHALSSVVATVVYGTILLIWPRRLDRPFRLAGFVLVFAALAKALRFPIMYAHAFGQMPPIVNGPTLLYLCLTAILVFFSMRTWNEPWPLDRIRPRPLWPVVLALFTFFVMNVEIASVFGRGAFSFYPDGNWGKSFGYSLGWLFFAIGLLAAGIRLGSGKTRWAAIGLLAVTAGKIFFSDLWALGQLYRVGSFIGLAVVLILVSYLYQRFIASDRNTAEPSTKERNEPA
ncbi:hypothetical protein JCM14469_42440 [Desulfatiferula olefinivorans]